MSVQHEIKAFLQQFNLEDDEPVCSYLESLIVESEEEGAEMAEITCSFLEGASPAFAALPELEKLPVVLELYQKCCPTTAEAPQDKEEAQGSKHEGELPPLERLSIVEPGTQSAAQGTSEKRDSEGVSDQDGASSQDSVDPWVEQLQALCPCSLSSDFLSHVLHMQGGLEGAAEWVLEVDGDIKNHEAGWLRHQERAREEARQAEILAQKSRETILGRYDLEALKLIEAGSKPKTSKEKDLLLHGGKKKEEPKAKETIRYVDGQPVRCKKGEKFITETVKEEWNGGSTGKVYTKGKRGKGFV